MVVDVRVGSPTFGRWVGETLSSRNARQLFVPSGLAHGFCTLSERAVFLYKCSNYYDPGAEATISWQDPDIGVRWPVSAPTLSAKDAAGRPLAAFDRAALPVYEAN